MDYGERIAAWTNSLTDSQFAKARSVQGELPMWLVGSLRAAGLKPVAFETTVDGVTGHGLLMPTAVRDALVAADRRQRSDA